MVLQVVIAGPRGDVATEALIQAAHSVFAPDQVLRIETRASVLGCGRLSVFLRHQQI